MKKLILALFTLLPFSAFCQTAGKTLSDKIAVGFTFSPDYCYRTLSSDGSFKWMSDMSDNMEIPKLGYTTGASITFRLSSLVSLESGLLLSDKGYKTKKMYYSSQVPDPFMPLSSTQNYHFMYLDIPTKINYYFLTGKVKLFASAGTSTNIFLTERKTSTVEYRDGKTKTTSTKISGFSTVNLAAVAGLGVDYDLTSKLRLRVEPIFRHSITSIISNTPIKGYLYSSGVNFGVFLKM